MCAYFVPHETDSMSLKPLKIAALFEGSSLLALLFIAMPLKYGYDMPEAVSLIGPIHGVLFILFNVMIGFYALKRQLTEAQIGLGVVASLIPFGTFIYKAKMLKED